MFIWVKAPGATRQAEQFQAHQSFSRQLLALPQQIGIKIEDNEDHTYHIPGQKVNLHINKKQNVCSKCFLLSNQKIKALSFDVIKMSLNRKSGLENPILLSVWGWILENNFKNPSDFKYFFISNSSLQMIYTSKHLSYFEMSQPWKLYCTFLGFNATQSYI